jgi:transcriptional regulator with PAS, ATPase and Fis domain
MRSNISGNEALNHETFIYENLIFDSFWDAFGDLSIGIIVVDRNTIVRFLNSMAGYFMGIQPSLAMGKPVQDILSETQIVETISKGMPHYEKHKIINGRQLKCSSIPIKIQGKIVAAVQFMIDHTERASMAYELKSIREKYDFLEVLLDETFEELGAVDKDGRITYVSRKSAQNLGFSRHEILGSDISDIDKKCLLKQVANTGDPYLGQISRKHKKPVPVMVAPIHRDNKLAGAVCRSIFTDMREAKEFVIRIEKFDESQKFSQHPRKISGCRFSFDDIIGKSKTLLSAKKKPYVLPRVILSYLSSGNREQGRSFLPKVYIWQVSAEMVLLFG